MGGVGAQGADGSVKVLLFRRPQLVAAFQHQVGDGVSAGARERLRNPAGGGGRLGVLWQQRRAGIPRFRWCEGENQVRDHRHRNPASDDKEVGEPG